MSEKGKWKIIKLIRKDNGGKSNDKIFFFSFLCNLIQFELRSFNGSVSKTIDKTFITSCLRHRENIFYVRNFPLAVNFRDN